MLSENNPIEQLLEDVCNGQISPEEAGDKINAFVMSKRVKKKHCIELLFKIFDSHINNAGMSMFLFPEYFDENELVIAYTRLVYGNFLNILGQNHIAENQVSLARKHFLTNKQPIGCALCDFMSMGIKLDKENTNLEALLKEFNNLKVVFREYGLLELEAECLAKVAHIFTLNNNFDEACKAYDSARGIYASLGLEENIAELDAFWAGQLFAYGDMEEAYRLSNRSKDYFESQGDNIVLAGIYNLIGLIFCCYGLFKAALSNLTLAEQIYEENMMDAELTRCKTHIANIQSEEGDFKNSVICLSFAIDILDEKGLHAISTEIKARLARMLVQLGDYVEAESIYHELLEFFLKSGNKLGLMTSYAGMGDCCFLQEDNEKAVKYYLSAQDTLIGSGSQNFYTMEIKQCLANVYTVLEKYDEAHALYNESKHFFEMKANRLQAAYSEFGMGKISYLMGNYRDALDTFRKVTPVFEAPSASAFLWKALFNTGLTHVKLGNIVDASVCFKKTIELLEKTRGSVPVLSLRDSYLGSVSGAYFEMIKVCILSNELNSALEYIEQLKSRNIMDLIEGRAKYQTNVEKDKNGTSERLREELKAYIYQLNREKTRSTETVLGDIMHIGKKYEDSTDLLKTSSFSLGDQLTKHISYQEINNLLQDDKSAIIELFPMSDKTLVFVIMANKQLSETTYVIKEYNEYNLTENVSDLFKINEMYGKDECSSQDWQKHFDEMMAALYSKLFGKIIPLLSGVRKIIFIPYRGFHFLPLHAMVTEDNGHKRYIIDDFEISYAPSAKILKKCREGKRKPTRKMCIALSRAGKGLPFASREAEAIQTIFGGAVIKESVNRDDIIDLGREADILHYVGHASYNSLLLHSRNDLQESEEYTVDEILQTLSLPNASLTILSACETGMSFPGGTDEYIGLPASFLCSGSATVISSLWCVHDIPTFLLMKKFYSLIREGKGKAESLRTAQLWLKDPSNRGEHYLMIPDDFREPVKRFYTDFSNPYCWSGFICSGAE